MKKLLNLLNEHAHTYAEHYDDTGEEITITFTGHYDQCFHYTVDDKEGIQTLVDDVVISKRFGFIKWLVENDKIGRNKNSDRSVMLDLMRAVVKEQTEVFEGIERYEWYIMNLSIQDNPIEFLISILK